MTTVNYNDSEKAREVAKKARNFMENEVIPVERSLTENISEEELEKLQDKAREYGVYGPQIPQEYGGLGLNFIDVLPVFEEVGRSILGPASVRADAPDEGNMHLLEMVGSESQKREWLEPLARGDIKSGFSMTEPMQGGGSDPKMIKTTAEKQGSEYVINGHKWWTTQGNEADVLIVMARTDPDVHPYRGCSLFLVPSDSDGVEIVRDIPHLGGEPVDSSHAEIIYDNVRVPEENLLGGENEGFSIAQRRLGPARLTHCMRFSGMTERALDVAKAYMEEREAFSSKLTDKQSLRFDIAEAETRLHGARTMVRHAAEKISEGEEARVEVGMSKVYTANVVQDVVDTCIQICGGSGISKDLPLADFYENVRSFRIVDGADEVHKRVIAREAFEDVDKTEIEKIPRFSGS